MAYLRLRMYGQLVQSRMPDRTRSPHSSLAQRGVCRVAKLLPPLQKGSWANWYKSRVMLVDRVNSILNMFGRSQDGATGSSPDLPEPAVSPGPR